MKRDNMLRSPYMKLRSWMSARVWLTASSICLLSLVAVGQTTDEPIKLIESITAPQNMDGLTPGNLRDGRADTKYHTWDETDTRFSGEQYLEVTLTSSLELADDEDIIVFLQRCDDCDNRQPTVFKVTGSEDNGSNWEDFCHVYFLYRGKSTKEYSARIHTTKHYKKLRFYVIANNTRSYDSEGHHSMGLSEFEIYKVKRNGYYPSPMADQFHLRNDYKRDYEDYKFVKTMGWLDARNRSESNTTANQPAWRDDNLNNEAFDKGAEDKQKANINKLISWADWDKDWSLTGEWNLDEDKLLELGIQIPSLAPIKNDPDFDPKANMQCQPTHVTEHILYAMPGDPIILTPYGNFAEAKHFEKYEVNFAHWYDYRTGDKIIYDDGKGNVTNLLDFLADPWGVCTSENNGFFGAYLLSEKKVGDQIHLPGRQAQNYGMSATFFCPRDPYFENGVAHSLPFRKIDEALSNNIEEEAEFVIAADFSQSFNKGRNLDTAQKQIIEPNIAFRHIFRIRDGKALADALSGSVDNNKTYVRRNRRDITARAHKPFQIGLDISVPKPWDASDGHWRSVPSEYYYKISDSDYRRIDAMRIKVTRPDGTPVADLSNLDSQNSRSIFYFGESYDGLGSRSYDGATYYIGGRRTRKWDANDNDEEGVYYRMLKSDQSLSGKYKVEIIGQEIIGEKAPTDINVFGSETPLVVMEFDIDFVDNEDTSNPKAILVSSEKLHSEDKFKFAREEEMIKKYGQPKDRINFDYYRGLETLPTWNQYLDARINGSKHYQFRWPAAWSKSQYANGYSNDHNYNMYVVANHTSRTPYHNFWHNNDLHKDEETSGLYDRLNDKTTRLHNADETVAVENGYFLYVNAASDPGVMATLDVDNLCTGSTVHVSAWVAELSKEEEMANIVFNFVAVLANGDRVNLHSFVSGYIPRNIGDYNNPTVNSNDGGPGQWMNINYSFNPDVTRFNASQIDHYELELENNCKSSSGADYAIDDISVYIVSPVVSAEQESPLCTDVADGEENLIRIETPFTETLQSIDVAEANTAAEGKVLKLQYVILDREKFDKAYETALKNGDENPGKTAFETEGVKIGSGIGEEGVDLSSYPGSIANYNDVTKVNEAGMRTDERGVRMLAFKTNFNDTKFRVGKEYYISLYVSESEGAITADWTQFDIKDPCAKYCIFKVRSKNNIRVDGEIREQTGEISVCEGEAPTISVDIATKENSKEYLSAYCDWFLGTREEYDAIEEGEMSLYKAMTYFREVYPEATSPKDMVAKDAFTEEMKSYILANADKLIFHQNSYKFQAITIPEGEKTAEDVVLVLPIPASEDDNVTVCTAPMEIHIYADMHSPKLLHGLREGITYPVDIENVPLRIGLDQLSQVTVEDKAADTTGSALLMIPIRTVESSGVVSDIKGMSRKSDILLLESTTDPNYNLEPTTEISESGETYIVIPEYEAGRICSFKAQINGNENSLGAVFFKSFTFREGYEYTFSYVFKEAVAPDSNVKLCDGRTRFTIKVVPEYLEWTPREDNRNWNNDGNWKRVASTDLHADFENDDVKTRLNDKVSDGSNSNGGAYVPMDFTKVILPAVSATAKAPFMYEFKGIDNGTIIPDQSGAATPLIEYDMVAKETAGNVECRPWYANTCAEIHFKPYSEILGQQYLVYDKAWVDLELDPYRWYTLAMPLKKVFAGEFYLPTKNARQESEFFQPITFNKNLNDRFNPAVFQRGWDKGAAQIYHPDGSTSTAVVKANWSHVYNDVEESYGSGVGFSIKADASSVTSAPEKVLFRLPKADESYDYYHSDGDSGQSQSVSHGTDQYRLNDTHGTITAENAGNDYFLVGNPFMAHLDMKKFLQANSDKIEAKYWLITSGTQKATVFNPETENFEGDDISQLPPMQGFFVKAKNNGAASGTDFLSEGNTARTIELSYDESMMCENPAAQGAHAAMKVASRGSASEKLIVNAINDGEISSTASVCINPFSSMGYNNEEDMCMLDNSDLEVRSTVYTVGDGKALSVNSTDEISNIELGLIALPEEETILHFINGTSSGNLMLYDALIGNWTPITDGMEYPVSGSTAGRLFITNGQSSVTEIISSIGWSVSGNDVEISTTTANPQLSVRVYDYSGRCILSQSGNHNKINFSLPSGIFIIEASDGTERICRQIVI